MTGIVRCAALLAALALSPAAHAADAHVHGTASLHVAVEGDRLTLEFASPLDNLVGFEHAPRNDKQKAAIQRMNERLREPERLFVPTPEAACKRGSADVEQKSKGAHASVETAVEFRCAQPQKLTGIDVKAFEAFPNLKRLDVKIAGVKKQSGAKLTPRNTRVSW